MFRKSRGIVFLQYEYTATGGDSKCKDRLKGYKLDRHPI